MSTLAEVQAEILNEESAPTADRRRDVRHKATYRPCCVIAANKVTMGLIRNFSVGGAKIEVDAELKIGDRVNYFWEANSCIAAKVAWSDGKSYGLEHLDTLPRRRKAFPMRSVRVPCEAEAQCWVKGEPMSALVENISIGGMRVRGLPKLPAGALMSLTFCGLEFDAASVRWHKNGLTGIRFARRLTREALAQLLLDERFGLASIDFENESAVA